MATASDTVQGLMEGRMSEECWCLYGRAHRLGGPQHTLRDQDGSLIREDWREEDIHLRTVEDQRMEDVQRSHRRPTAPPQPACCQHDRRPARRDRPAPVGAAAIVLDDNPR